MNIPHWPLLWFKKYSPQPSISFRSVQTPSFGLSQDLRHAKGKRDAIERRERPPHPNPLSIAADERAHALQFPSMPCTYRFLATTFHSCTPYLHLSDAQAVCGVAACGKIGWTVEWVSLDVVYGDVSGEEVAACAPRG